MNDAVDDVDSVDNVDEGISDEMNKDSSDAMNKDTLYAIKRIIFEIAICNRIIGKGIPELKGFNP